MKPSTAVAVVATLGVAAASEHAVSFEDAELSVGATGPFGATEAVDVAPSVEVMPCNARSGFTLTSRFGAYLVAWFRPALFRID